MNQQDNGFDQHSLDDRLKHLAMEAQQHPPKSQARQRALSRLLNAVSRSKRLSRPRRNQFQEFYEEIYAEAVQRLFAYVCEKIDSYSPDRGEVLQWMNFLLNQRFFIEASREILPVVHQGVDPRRIQRVTIDDLDRNNPSEVNPQLIPSLSQEVAACLEDDPEGLFQAACVANSPNANFQVLALRRMAGYSWQEIASELNMNAQTLSSFYQRSLTKFTPKFKEYLL
ncbi:sigma-70 region 4 domain-containing protein [Microcoleus sp. FACHB-1515]|uniref:sigma-70 region 4 domain-containing protein n=1 Tax=Cyanophyceae TaxID=3028117 RepID=UPI001684EFF8|nr:sigma-70 region 4 domain-containing protein [Microcoleus sp. FACHB-1515]MBD2088583.1 sigma-70 region 4 domain-containing protein [Microcoleus sp. FACHB-1515]